MKKTILLTLVFLCAIISNAQENWITFINYPIDVNIDLEKESKIKDTPFVYKNETDQVKSYLLPVKFSPIKEDGLSDLNIKIKSVNASYDLTGRLMLYFRGKIDMSCCYKASIALKFYDDQDNLVQTAKTDEFGNFKLKSISGNLIELNEEKIKFNFTKLESFDANADTRFAELKTYDKPIDEQFKSLQDNSVVNTDK